DDPHGDTVGTEELREARRRADDGLERDGAVRMVVVGVLVGVLVTALRGGAVELAGGNAVRCRDLVLGQRALTGGGSPARGRRRRAALRAVRGSGRRSPAG